MNDGMPDTLTKADTVALWHAVRAMDDLITAMRGMDFKPEQIAAEQKRLTAAKRALRKVNAIRAAAATGEKRG